MFYHQYNLEKSLMLYAAKFLSQIFAVCSRQYLFSRDGHEVLSKIFRLLLQTTVIAFVVIYQLWYARGYQEFAEVEASVTTKVKGFSK